MDNVMHDTSVTPNAVSSLTNVVVISDNGVIGAAFTRTLAAPSGDDMPFTTSSGASQKLIWAVHPTVTCNGCVKHTTVTMNAGTLVTSFAQASTCSPAPPTLAPAPPCTTTAPAAVTPGVPVPAGGDAVQSPDGMMSVSWIVTGMSIEITMTAKAAGYVGVGWAAAGSMPHINADMIVGWVDDASGVPTLLDTYSTQEGQPATDAHDDVTLVNGTQIAGTTSITFTRLLVTGDAMDIGITSANVLLQYCYHHADTFLSGEVHDSSFMQVGNFLGAVAPQAPTPPSAAAPANAVMMAAGKSPSPTGSLSIVAIVLIAIGGVLVLGIIIALANYLRTVARIRAQRNEHKEGNPAYKRGGGGGGDAEKGREMAPK
jgi:hypothetical protein